MSVFVESVTIWVHGWMLIFDTLSLDPYFKIRVCSPKDK